MSWYRAGTVSVSQGSNAVIGVGTAFISNARVGDAFRGPDGGWYEITNIASNTALSIAPNYQGPTLASGGYSLAPMQGYVKDSADQLRAATKTFANAATDMTDQIDLAKAASDSAKASSVTAGQYKDATALSALTASQASTSANTSKLAAKSSEDAAKASADRAAASSAVPLSTQLTGLSLAISAAISQSDTIISAFGKLQAQLGNKAGSGVNADITRLTGLTTALTVAQGGTGGNTPALARSALELKSAATAEVVASNLDSTGGRVLTVSAHGVGGFLPQIQSVAVDDLRSSGRYFCLTTSGQGSLPQNSNGYIESTVYASSYAAQHYTNVTTGVEFKRLLLNSVWQAWKPVISVDTITLDPSLGSGGVVSSGSNANGEYVKFADGTLICSLSILVTDQAINLAYGNLFQGTREWTFPVPFLTGTLPSVVCGAFRWGNSASWAAVRIVNANLSATLRGFDIASRPVGTEVSITATAIGRWKA